jgi:Mor family transcriptional regulator
MKKKQKAKCKNCWDKGFASQIVRVQSFSDMKGDKYHEETKEIKIYCNCDKGRRLERLAKKLTPEGNK